MSCEKYAVKHKNFAHWKICICQKVVVTLHSLSGSNGAPGSEKSRSNKDIEKAYNRQRSSARERKVT